MKGAIYNESPDERTERFMRLVEAEERRRLKEEYRAERRKDKVKEETYDRERNYRTCIQRKTEAEGILQEIQQGCTCRSKEAGEDA